MVRPTDLAAAAKAFQMHAKKISRINGNKASNNRVENRVNTYQFECFEARRTSIVPQLCSPCPVDLLQCVSLCVKSPPTLLHTSMQAGNSFHSPMRTRTPLWPKKHENSGLSNKEIGEEIPYLGRPIPSETVRRTFAIAKDRSEGADALPILLERTARKKGSGRPKLIVAGDPLSEYLYRYIHKLKQTENALYPSIFEASPEIKEKISSRIMRRHCLQDLHQK